MKTMKKDNRVSENDVTECLPWKGQKPRAFNGARMSDLKLSKDSGYVVQGKDEEHSSKQPWGRTTTGSLVRFVACMLSPRVIMAG